MRLRHAGFTLVELMVTVTLSVILIAIATPSFVTLLASRAAQAAADSLVSDLRLARFEAIKLSRTVSVCSSISGDVCSDSASWKDGWIVFVDAGTLCYPKVLRLTCKLGIMNSLCQLYAAAKQQKNLLKI